jgi:CDP-glucose 4,6-dehydratase
LVRDYFYVEDGAAAYMLLAEKLAENPSLRGEAFNFSNELQLPVIDLVNLILTKMGSKFDPIILNEVTNEISHQYLSAQKARKKLEWKPLFSLDHGLELTIDWYKKFLSRPN